MIDKTFSIKTLGCKLNQYESSMIAGRFLANGWTAKPFGDENVDIVIINTCTVTDRSDKKCRNYIRQGARFSRTGGVLVTGCMAESDAGGVKGMPGVSAVYKNSEKDKIFYDSVKGTAAEGSDFQLYNSHLVDDADDDCDVVTSSRLTRTRGFIKIQDGCDGACSYCVVPSVRGVPSSREYGDILKHAEKLINDGCPEIVLTGITIGKYHNNGRNLSDIVNDIICIPGHFRVRITSIEPNHLNNDIIALLENEKVCPHLHIPLQSGSDRILHKMKRRYNSGEYIDLIKKIKSRLPDIAIGTDIIIGFPGEEDEDFNASLMMIEDAGFSYVHQFTFSSRSGTDASKMKWNCASRKIKERSAVMKELSLKVGLEYRRRFIGKVLPSVIEKNGNRGISAVSGNYIRISLDESPLNAQNAGRIARVRLLEAETCRVRGIISPL